MKAYKGFNKNMKCRDMQYEEGKEYFIDKDPKICSDHGFHSCEKPIDTLCYYPPANSIFHEVEIDGKIDRCGKDTKVASQKIKIGANISLKTMIEASVKFVFERCNWKKETGDQGAASQTGNCGAASQTGNCGAASQTGDRGAASQTGDQGAASQTGYQGAASQTGDQGAASQTGYQGAASQTGYQGAASQTGYQGAALTTGYLSRSEIKNTDKVQSKNSVAVTIGCKSNARAPIGCWLVISEWNKKETEIIRIHSIKIDGKRFMANTWYRAYRGKIVKVKNQN